MDNIAVSFCLPVYNVAPFLKACLQSIDNQQIRGYEVICVDDCSTDGSLSLLNNLKKDIKNLTILTNDTNRGVSYSRNKAIRHARGKYIWLVDPDDMIYPGMANLVIDAAEKNQADVLLGNYLRINENEDIKCPKIDSISVYHNAKCQKRSEDKNHRRMSAVWAGVFRRDFLLSNNLFFNENMVAQEDTLFYYQFTMKTERIFKFDEYVYIYRQRASSIMHRKDSEKAHKYYKSMHEMYKTYINHLQSGDYDDEEVLRSKIEHMQQNFVLTLSAIPDYRFVKKEFKTLKESKIYPYPKNYLEHSGFNKVLAALLPREWGFWTVFLMRKLRSALISLKRKS